ncbi:MULTISPECIES: aldo/keto reductase [unclassified Carboxylicivirga]|uniref:aldo/keto reductase n=1 Tax=Carboxylicivirga TaxID=1628153 RepID=UPI003D3291FE
MQTLNLNGYALPILGLGTWKSTPGEVYEAVKAAIEIGYRHIDCAAIYGNEKEVGKAINECIKAGLVKRDELWITSKLWNNMHGNENVVPALQKTLNDLQLEYLDLYLIHWPIAQKKMFVAATRASHFLSLQEQPIANTWEGMEQAVEQGLTKTIGVSNFSVKKLKDLMTVARIKPSLNQVEVHPYFQQDELVNYCHNNNIQVMAYSPLGSADRPKSFKAADEPVLLEDPIIAKLADKVNATPAQVILAWNLHRGISVIPKSVNTARLQQNLDALQVKLKPADMEVLKMIDKNRRYVDGKFWVVPEGPYTLENLWDE